MIQLLVRITLWQFFEALGRTDIDFVTSGDELVEKVRTGDYDGVFSDQQMGIDKTTGLDALRILREEGHDLPYLIVTTRPYAELVEAAEQLGGQGVVHKGAFWRKEATELVQEAFNPE